MHIALLTLRIPWPLRDGGAQATWGHAQLLREMGHRLTMLTLNTRKHRQEPAVLAELGTVVTTDIDTSLRPLAALQSLLGSTGYNIDRFYSPEHANRIEQTLLRDPADIVLLEGVYLAQYLPAIWAALPDVPVVLRAHNVEFEIWQRLARAERNPLKRWYYGHLARRGEAFERQSLKQFDGLLAITPRDLAHFQALGYTGASMWLPALYTGPLAAPPQVGSGAQQIGFLGSLDWLPNVQALDWFRQQVWPRVRERLPEATFHLAGRNAPREVAHWQAPGWLFRGEVEDAGAFLAGLDVVAVPLLAGSGMRLKLVEALARGKAVVASPVAAEGIWPLPQAGGDAPLLLAETPEEWAHTLARLITQPAKRQALGQAGLAHVANHFQASGVQMAYGRWLQALVANNAA